MSFNIPTDNNSNANSAPAEATADDIPQGLMDVAGMSFDDTEIPKFEVLPEGKMIFTADSAEMLMIETKNGATPVFKVRCKVQDAVLNNPNLTPADVQGKIHEETFFISTREVFGWVKQFLENIGYAAPKAGMNWAEIAQSIEGMGLKFSAVIKHTVKKEDPTVIYSNIDRKSVAIVA